MSGIAGIVDMRGGMVDGSIDLNLLERMMSRLRHRGPDGVAFWSGGPAGLAFAAMHTTPEAEREAQPHSDEQGWCRLIFDGRLDDRETLRTRLMASGQPPRQDTDAELVLRAYLAWGEECAAHLLGDFALALWDGRRRLLYCARDILGLRPFFYALTSGRFLFASEPRAILESPDVSREPDEAAVAAHISCDFQSNEETLYRDIRRLPPAHSVVVSAREVRLRRYWAPDPARRIRYSTQDQYCEHFLEQLRESVRDRTRARGPLGALLSGGLDSSSVVSVLLEQWREQGRPAEDLQTFSMIFPGEICDESGYLHEMHLLWGHTAHLLPLDPPDAGLFPRLAARDREFPGYPNGDLVFDPLKRLAREKGIRSLLTGLGGDEWLTGSYMHYADYLRSGSLRRLARQWLADRWQMPADRRFVTVTMQPRPILRYGIWPLLSPRARSVIKGILRRKGGAAGLLGRGLLARKSAGNWLETQRLGFPTQAQQHIASALNHPWQIQTMEILERSTAHFGIEMRAPFHDRRMIELALALPEDQRWSGLQTKLILRESMRGRIPESVRTRLNKAEFSYLVMETMLGLERAGIFDSLRIAQLGWIDPEAVRALWARLKNLYPRDDGEYTRIYWPLWMVLGLELWARASLDDAGA